MLHGKRMNRRSYKLITVVKLQSILKQKFSSKSKLLKWFMTMRNENFLFSGFILKYAILQAKNRFKTLELLRLKDGRKAEEKLALLSYILQ